MGLWNGTKKVLGTIVDYRVDRWLGFRSIKNSTESIWDSAKDLASIDDTQNRESFDEAMIRLQLTEADLHQRLIEFNRLFIIYMIIAIFIFIYSTYIAFHGNFGGFMIGFAITIFTLSQAFRYHFWIFQIKNKKLGCTIKEWLSDDDKESNDQ